jgi:hypothetical protein
LLYKTPVEYQVQRLFEGGRVLEKHLRLAGAVRGRLSITQELDTVRNRTTLVARLLCAGAGRGPVHPLYDVALIASSGNTWTLGWFERVEAGPLCSLHVLGQSWLIEPVMIQELMDVERKWSAAAGRVHDLEQQLIKLGLAPVPPQAGVVFT